MRGRKESKNITQIVVARAQTGDYIQPMNPGGPMPAQAEASPQVIIELVHVGTGEVIGRRRTPAAIADAVVAGIRSTMGSEYRARIAKAA